MEKAKRHLTQYTPFTARKWIYRFMLAISTFALVGFTGFLQPKPKSKKANGESLTSHPSPLAQESTIWKAMKGWNEAPLMTDEEQVASLTKSEILADKLGRIGDDFAIPNGLQERTQFWFDIYTRYGQYEHVIHHLRYPWIVFKVVDGNPVINTKKGPLWMRIKKVRQQVALEKRNIKRALRRLAQKRPPKKLTALERQLVKIMKAVPGKNRKGVYWHASNNIRSQLGQKDFFVEGIRRSTKYLPLMESEFEQMGLPLELTRMPFVESSFNEKAQSKVGASGIWQIMPNTGKAYSIVNNVIDERNSPLKATLTAGKVLKRYKRALKHWSLAITSYNHGIGNIRKAIKGARSQDIATIIHRYHRGAFKFASSNFYTSFLAALHAEKYQDALFKNVAKQPLLDFVEIHLGQNVRVKTLLKISGLSKEELFIYNRDLKVAIEKNARIPRGFRLHLPPEKADAMIKKISENIKIFKVALN